MMKLLTCAISAVVLASCASNQSKAIAETEPEYFVGGRTIVGDPGDKCSIDVEAIGDKEGLLTSLAAPFLFNLVSAGFDAVGNAITKAAAEKAKTYTPQAQPIALVTATEVTPKAEEAYKPSALSLEREATCVRTVYGKFELTADSGSGVLDFSGVSKGSFVNAQTLDPVLKTAINQYVPGKVEEIYFYSEHLVEPVAGASGSFYYRIVPVALWYNKAVNERRFKLTSLTFQMQALNAEDDAYVLSYSQTFEPSGLSEGTLFTHDTGGLSPSGLFISPPLAESETKAISAIKTAINTYRTSNEARFLLEDAEFDTYQGHKVEVERRAAATKLNKCISSAGGKQDKIDLCNAADADEKYVAEHITSVLAEAKSKRARVNISRQIQGLGEELGRYNVGASFTETREANAFFQAVGKAISDSKEERDTALKNYVNSQLGLTDDPSNLTEVNAYRSAKLAYDISLRKYNEAVLTGEQDKIDTALSDLVTKYNALTAAGETAGIPVTEPDPYP